jgi:DmsE family decaheme c-type cytochrome
MGQNLHQKNGVACDECHSSGHADEPLERYLLSAVDHELCSSCHARQKAQMQMPFRHRTSDGVLKCGDCHSPHSTTSRNSRRIAAARICLTCHTDKQGPFTYEHLSSTMTGCESCHEPHGSTNPRLLVRAEVRFLCLECHGDVPRFHNLSTPRFQNCTVCHTAIHGSHVDAKFMK